MPPRPQTDGRSTWRWSHSCDSDDRIGRGGVVSDSDMTATLTGVVRG